MARSYRILRPLQSARPRGVAVVISSRGLSADRRAGTPAPHRARVRGSRNPARTSWSGTRRSTFPLELLPKLAALGLMGIQFAGASTAARRCRRSTTASASKSSRACDPAIALSVAAHNGLCSSHIAHVRHRSAEAALPAAARAGRSPRRVGADRGERRQRRRRDADDGRARRRRLGHLTASKSFITHGAIGGVMVVMAVTDRAEGHRGISAFVVEHGTPGMRGRQEGKQARHARERHERSDLRGLPRAADAAARRGRPGVHQHAAGARRRPHRHRGAVGRPRAGRLRSRRGTTRTSARQFGQPIAASRRSSGSSPTRRRGSRPRGC